VPLDGHAPADRAEYEEYLTREYFARGIMTPADVVAGGHCLAPAFLANQLARSRENLGVEAIDIYYLHNPEQQLDVLDRETFNDRIRAAFQLLEERVAQREVGVFGCATWNGFRSPAGSRGHLSLAEVVELAREAGGEGHHFRVIQLPISLLMTEAVRNPTQRLADGRMVPLLHAAAELGVSVVASASLLQAQLASGLPPQMHDAFPGLTTDAQRALAFVRGLPLTAALVGMRSTAHVEENLVAGR
jgi:aryl-alcohol dehydrogenase-like predicted oxidoreductase